MTEPGPEVAVNLLWCAPGVVGGSEDYLVRQLTGLAEVAPQVRATLFCAPGLAAAHPGLTARHPHVDAPWRVGGRAGRIVAEHTWLARRARGADVVHHGGGTVPLVGGGPVVLTVHDLQYRDLPDNFTTARRWYLEAMMPRSARRAAVVTTPTEFVRDTVIDAFGVDPDRVMVVPHGVGDLGATATAEDVVRDRYGLGRRRVLVYPAITHPHKGHRFLLGVLARWWRDPDVVLVLLGGRGAADAEVDAAVRDLGLTDRVIRPGRVPAPDRDGLIAVADALVFPSRYEGFGAPVVEAMRLGTPVICSDHPALAEVVGPAGLVLPLDDEVWADALERATASRSELVAAGRERATRFTTAASGRALAAAYDLATGSR